MVGDESDSTEEITDLSDELKEIKEYLSLVESEIESRSRTVHAISSDLSRLKDRFREASGIRAVIGGDSKQIKAAYAFRDSLRNQIRRFEADLERATEDLQSAETRRDAVLLELEAASRLVGKDT